MAKWKNKSGENVEVPMINEIKKEVSKKPELEEELVMVLDQLPTFQGRQIISDDGKTYNVKTVSEALTEMREMLLEILKRTK